MGRRYRSPTVDIVSGFPVSSPTNQKDYTFIVSGGGATEYQYQFDGSPWSLWTPTTSALSLINLYDGVHTLNILGKDAAGNIQSAPTYKSWTMESARLEYQFLLNGVDASYGIITNDSIVYQHLEGTSYPFPGLTFFSRSAPSAEPVRMLCGLNGYYTYTNGLLYDEINDIIYSLSSRSWPNWTTDPEYTLCKIDGATKTVISSITFPIKNKISVSSLQSNNNIFVDDNYIFVYIRSDILIKLNKSTFTVDSEIVLNSPPTQNVSTACNINNILYIVQNDAVIRKYDMTTGNLLASAAGLTTLYITYNTFHNLLVVNHGFVDPNTLTYTKNFGSDSCATLFDTFYFYKQYSPYSSPFTIIKNRYIDDVQLQAMTINTSSPVGFSLYDSIYNRWWISNGTYMLVINP